MHLPVSFWASVTYIAAWLNPSPIDEASSQELLIPDKPIHNDKNLFPGHVTEQQPSTPLVPYPLFPAPDSSNHNFACLYPDMPEWRNCSTPDNRACWLRHPNGTELGIHTDYERIAPKGIQRNYTITIRDEPYNGDGMMLNEAKLIDHTFPGPYIEACWGDTVNVKVINNMNHNGTSIHWHGIRQLNTMHMDGVNGITQCPIAPGDSFTYTWRALQYGSSWYHSHYSVQYADGVLGPMTIHGPSSGSYDHAKRPTIMTDWGHNSAFQAMHKIPGTNDSYGINTPSILLNGTGNLVKFSGGVNKNTTKIPKPYTLTFEKRDITQPGRAKRYLLRLINTSFATTFVVSIDNHWMQVIEADFVPIEPYFNTSVLVGIGQRYHVIVEARPDAVDGNPIPADGNFWIRTSIAEGCGKVPQVKISANKTVAVRGYEEVGILRYDPQSTTEPTSKPWPGIPLYCSDETYTSLIPKRPWYVGLPVNDGLESEKENTGQWFDINLRTPSKNKAYPLGIFSMDPHSDDPTRKEMVPFRVDYSKPMFLNLSHHGLWEKEHVVVPENFGEDDWVYLTILGGRLGKKPIVAHPIHLHGHDFALLQQSESPFNASSWKPSEMKLVNPPRRDVVLVPANGFVIIAFKTDNPGNWLMHCHIAKHASEGLSLQILERQQDAYKMWPENSRAAVAAERLCHNWNVWVSDCQKWWHGDEKNKSCNATHPHLPSNGYIFQDDSGI